MAKKHSRMLSSEVIKRFIGDFDSFLEQYNEARFGHREVRKPSDNDRRIAQRFEETKSLSETAKAFDGVSISRVLSAIARVTAWKKTQ